MEEQKVYLFVETPFSFAKPKGRMLLPMTLSLLIYAALVAMSWFKKPEDAVLLTAVFGCVFVLNVICIVVFRLSYVTAEDGCLVCSYGGLIPKKIFITNRIRYQVFAGQLKVKSGAAVLLQIPDSDAAKRLMAAARIPQEG